MEKNVQFNDVFGENPVNVNYDEKSTILDLKKSIVKQLDSGLDLGENYWGGLFKVNGSDLLILYSSSYGVFPDQELISHISEDKLTHLIYYFADSHIFALDRIILENGRSLDDAAKCVLVNISNSIYPIILPKNSSQFKDQSFKNIVQDQLTAFDVNISRMSGLRLIHQRTGHHLSLIDSDQIRSIEHGDVIVLENAAGQQFIEETIRILNDGSGDESLDVRVFDEMDIKIQSQANINGVSIEAVRGNIVDQSVTAVVTAANSTLVGGGGVDGVIHSSAGPRLVRASKILSPCDPGSAVLTPGFELLADWVIHAVGPIYRDGMQNEDQILANAYQACMKIAVHSGFESVAFPAISTGVYGFPVIHAGKIAVSAVVEEVKSLRDHELKRIIFVLFNDQDLDLYQQLLGALSFEND